MVDKKPLEDISKPKKARYQRWAFRLSFLLFLFLMVEAGMTWFLPMKTQEVNNNQVEVVKKIDCMSCRWLMSEQAFRQGNYDTSLQVLHGASPEGAWYWVFQHQRDQIEAYRKTKHENQPRALQWLNMVGVAITHKDPSKYDTSDSRLRYRSILSTYGAVIKEII